MFGMMVRMAASIGAIASAPPTSSLPAIVSSVTPTLAEVNVDAVRASALAGAPSMTPSLKSQPRRWMIVARSASDVVPTRAAWVRRNVSARASFASTKSATFDASMVPCIGSGTLAGSKPMLVVASSVVHAFVSPFVVTLAPPQLAIATASVLNGETLTWLLDGSSKTPFMSNDGDAPVTKSVPPVAVIVSGKSVPAGTVIS